MNKKDTSLLPLGSFMDLPDEYSGKDSYFCIQPIPFEGNMTAQTGARNGPRSILEASRELEYFDMQTCSEPFQKGIYVLSPIALSTSKEADAIKTIASSLSQFANDNPDRFVLSLGGDHSITQGVCKGFDTIDDNYGVLIFDAHADLRYSWNNSPQNHACTARVVSENHPTTIVGVRSMDADEKEYASSQKNVFLYPSSESTEASFQKILAKMPEKIYLSIDCDVFDPSFLRYTGTPEPGGLFWNDMLSFLDLLFRTKTVFAADIVEFSPREEFACYAERYALAKLVYHIFALKK
jgi:agmatinase